MGKIVELPTSATPARRESYDRFTRPHAITRKATTAPQVTTPKVITHGNVITFPVKAKAPVVNPAPLVKPRVRKTNATPAQADLFDTKAIA